MKPARRSIQLFLSLFSINKLVLSKFQDGKISSSYLPCLPGQLPGFPCKIPVAITMCQEVNSTFTSKYPDKFQKFSYGRQVNQTVALLKSLAITLHHSILNYATTNISDEQSLVLSRKNVFLEIFVFGNNKGSFEDLVNEVGSWETKYNHHFLLHHMDAVLTKDFEWSADLFAPCTTIRLQFPQLLPKVDSLIYVDTDVLFMQHISQLWSQFDTFPAQTSLGMALESQIWIRDKLMSVVGLRSVKSYNAGVMLMNLTKLRADEEWKPFINNEVKEFKDFLTYADQDILNLYIHKNQEKLYQLPCQWNFLAYYVVRRRQWFCPLTSSENSVGLLHGTLRSFFRPGRFSAFFKVYQEASLEKFKMSNFIARFLEALEPISYCELFNKVAPGENVYQTVPCKDAYFEMAFITPKIERINLALD